MPVFHLHCPDCGHDFRSLVMEGTRVPPVWVCSVCESRRAHPQTSDDATGHPFDAGPDGTGSTGCACCG